MQGRWHSAGCLVILEARNVVALTKNAGLIRGKRFTSKSYCVILCELLAEGILNWEQTLKYNVTNRLIDKDKLSSSSTNITLHVTNINKNTLVFQ